MRCGWPLVNIEMSALYLVLVQDANQRQSKDDKGLQEQHKLCELPSNGKEKSKREYGYQVELLQKFERVMKHYIIL